LAQPYTGWAFFIEDRRIKKGIVEGEEDDRGPNTSSII